MPRRPVFLAVSCVVDLHQHREGLPSARVVALAVRLLEDLRQTIRLHLDADVLIEEVFHHSVAACAYIECGSRIADEVAVAEADVAEMRRPRLDSRLDGVAPSAPQHAPLHRDVLHGLVAVRRHALDNNRIVERAHKAITHRHAPRVADVNPVRVVAPLSDDLDVPDGDVLAVEAGQHPAR